MRVVDLLSIHLKIIAVTWIVGLYFDTACKELLESKEIDENFFDRERILEILNGTSNVESTQFSS